jgi:hypothetical protein
MASAPRPPSIVPVRRLLLLAVAGLLSASALLAIGILLLGHFGDTEGRILSTTALLAGYGLISLPSTILLDQRRSRSLACTGVGLAVVAAALSVATVWTEDPAKWLGKTMGTTAVTAVAAAQAAALTARRRDDDPVSVRRLFALSCVLAAVVAAMAAAAIWWEIDSSGFYRVFGAAFVLDLLTVALQPILVRARPTAATHWLSITVASGETLELEVEAPDLATAVARSIRSLERDGRTVDRIEVGRT